MHNVITIHDIFVLRRSCSKIGPYLLLKEFTRPNLPGGIIDRSAAFLSSPSTACHFLSIRIHINPLTKVDSPMKCEHSTRALRLHRAHYFSIRINSHLKWNVASRIAYHGKRSARTVLFFSFLFRACGNWKCSWIPAFPNWLRSRV